MIEGVVELSDGRKLGYGETGSPIGGSVFGLHGTTLCPLEADPVVPAGVGAVPG